MRFFVLSLISLFILLGCVRHQITPEMMTIMKDSNLISFEEIYKSGKLSKHYGEAGMCAFDKDYECAIDLYERIAKFGKHEEERGSAECALATYYRVGGFVDQDIELAKELAKSACDKKLRCGCIEAQFIKELELK